MKTYIALLRGINVGGHKKVPMATLRQLLENIGFNNVKTYIQSGNIIFNASEEKINNIENEIEEIIFSHFKFQVPVIVKTREALETIFNACPFSETKKSNSYFILLSNIPETHLIDEANKISFENEEFKIIKDCIYFYSSIGYGRTKFNMNSFEKKLEVNATSRNCNTTKKLLELSQL
ncbi:DUF1697 domain-containing protein [Lacinutrix chionoecetis]